MTPDFRAIREAVGATREEIAAEIGVATHTIDEWEQTQPATTLADIYLNELQRRAKERALVIRLNKGDVVPDDEINQVSQALRAIGEGRTADEVDEVIRRQYFRRGYTSWKPGAALPLITLSETLRNWVLLFDLPLTQYRGRFEDGVGGRFLRAISKLEALL